MIVSGMLREGRLLHTKPNRLANKKKRSGGICNQKNRATGLLIATTLSVLQTVKSDYLGKDREWREARKVPKTRKSNRRPKWC